MEKLSPEQPNVAASRKRSWRWMTNSERNFHATTLVWLGVAGALWLIGRTIARLTPAPVPDPKVVDAFVPWVRNLLAPEPDERRLYTILTLLAPLLLLAAWGTLRWLSPRTTGGRAGSSDQGSSWVWRIGSLAVVAILIWIELYLCRAPRILSLVFQPSAPVFWWVPVGVVLVWLILVRWVSHRPRRLWRNVTFAVALPVIVAGTVIYKVLDYHTAGLINPPNMDTVLYPVAQAFNGQHTLVDFIPQYGCYGALLVPWFTVVGLNVFMFSATLIGLQIIAMAAVVFVLSRLMRSGWLVLLCLSALIWQGDIWQQVLLTFDPYLQYYPIRVIFPMLSLLTAWRALHRPTRGWAITAGLLGGLATWWNIDSGAITLVSLLALYFVRVLARRGPLHSAERLQAVQLLGLAMAGAAFALAGFYLVLCWQGRQWIHSGAIFQTQNLFVAAGFYMMRMPADLSLWHLVVGVYLLGLAVPLGSMAARRSLGAGQGMILYLSILGLGLFSYYQGRSHDFVLMLCVWPALLLSVLMIDRLLAATRYRLLPISCSTAVLPALLLLSWCGTSLWQARGTIVQINLERWHLMREKTDITGVPSGVGYIKRVVPRNESCAVISPWDAIYYTALGRPSGFVGQSLQQCYLKTDIERYQTQIRARRVRHIFTQRTLLLSVDMHPLGPDFYRTLFDAYEPTDRGPGFNLLHWQPRPDAEMHDLPSGGRLAHDFEARSRLRASPPTPRHALRFAPSNLLFKEDGECGSTPQTWGQMDFEHAWAIEMVFTPALQQPVNACLVSNHPGRLADGLTVQWQAGGPHGVFVCSFGDGTRFLPSAPMEFTPGQGHYLVLSGTGHVLTIFVDGVQQSPLTLAVPIPASVTPLTIGDWIGQDRPFQGEITEVKIHAQALSAEMVTRNEQNIQASSDHLQ